MIKKKLAGQELPSVLPPSLIPPALRSSTFGQSPFSPAGVQVHTQSEPDVDLFSFDDPLPATFQTPAQPSNILKPETTGSHVPAVSSVQKRPIDHDPFTVDREFYRCTPCNPSHVFPASHQDFLSDDNIRSLHDQSAEIGNVGNQLQSTEKSLSATKQEQQTLQQTLVDQASQLSTLQTQLSSAKAAYETEMTLLSALKERRSAQIAEIQKAREELIRAESNLSAIRVEKSEIEGVFLRDKEEARDLHKRMIEASQQAEILKANVEKLKKEAKQQRGLLAIARKQLSTKETEKSKVEKEYQEANIEVMALDEEKNALEAEIVKSQSSLVKGVTASDSDSLSVAAAQPLPPTPDPSQPVRINSNNPFEKLARSSTPRSQSPFQMPRNTSPPINGTILSVPDIASDTTFEATEEEKPSDRSPRLSRDDLKMKLPSLHTDGLDVHEGTSPSIDAFVTPLSTASPPTVSESTISPTTPKFPVLEDVASAVGSAAKVSSPQSISQESSTHVEADLTHQLVELNADESDSDSDEESDESRPLGDVKQRINGKFTSAVADREDSVPLQSGSVHPASTSFEEIFGPGAPQDQNQVKEGTPSLESQPKATSDSKPAEDTPHVAGVAEFDETFRSIQTSTSAAPLDFFDDIFEPSFDFPTAKIEDTASPIEATSQLQSKPFDNVFKTDATPAHVNTDINQPISTNNESRLTSFDAVFNDPDSSKLDKQIGLQSSPVASPVPAIHKDSVATAFPSHPDSPSTSRPSNEREKSPPPRIVSPKPRVSSSSKEAHEKLKDPPRSKLSVSFPFISYFQVN